VTNRQWGGELFIEDMQNFGLLEYFDPRYIAISGDLGIRKPNADIFLYALNGLGYTPEEAAMVGDSLSADVVGAKRVNSTAIWKPKPFLLAEARAAQPQSATLKEEHVLDYIKSWERKHWQLVHEDVRPDVIIEDLSNLLDVFPGVEQS
jgi:FMN phosphatase YigB (HAD superfamily)